ncbi:RHM1 [Symbiodinium pilosum]|uniref:RHM1 protein n=1 Tax=Symbiodinium pilosum TaxID=2952 RepID=A0A812NGL2_SYMPI|nr:RHM1 [Symbiodinium pilosum]
MAPFVLVALLVDDTLTSTAEENWFYAHQHIEELSAIMTRWTGERTIHCIDLFGYSGSVAKYWRDQKYEAYQYDIKFNVWAFKRFMAPLSSVATWLQLLESHGRKVFWVLEQPANSWLFKLNFMLALGTGAFIVNTWKLG